MDQVVAIKKTAPESPSEPERVRVADLIDALSTLPPDALVAAFDDDDTTFTLDYIVLHESTPIVATLIVNPL